MFTTTSVALCDHIIGMPGIMFNSPMNMFIICMHISGIIIRITS
ncbi:hypothetical protein ACWF82_07805 [Nocardia sp. NPDC055053]